MSVNINAAGYHETKKRAERKARRAERKKKFESKRSTRRKRQVHSDSDPSVPPHLRDLPHPEREDVQEDTREDIQEDTGESREARKSRMKPLLPSLPPNSDPYSKYLHRRQKNKMTEQQRTSNPIKDFADKMNDQIWEEIGPDIQRDWNAPGGAKSMLGDIPSMLASARASTKAKGTSSQSRTGRKRALALSSRSKQFKSKQEHKFRRNARNKRQPTITRGPKINYESAMDEMLSSLF